MSCLTRAKNRTTVVAGTTLPCPARTTSALRAPIRRRTGPAFCSSSWAVIPLIARTIPPGRTRPTASSASRGSGATARAVATSARSRPALATSSARPRSTLALARPSSVTHSARNRQRRSMGSSRVIVTSGRSMARTRPGSPAPEPMSTSVRYCPSISSATTAQLSRCLSHSLGTSRGPIRPCSTPRVARTSAKASAVARAGPNTLAALAGSGGITRRGRRSPAGSVPHPPTRCAGLPPPPRRERSSARTATWPPASSARPSGATSSATVRP